MQTNSVNTEIAKPTPAVQARLGQLKLRRNAIDIGFCVGFFFLLSLYSALFYQSLASSPQHGVVVNAIASFLGAVFAGYPTLLILQPLSTWSLNKFAPTWCIDMDGDAVKIHGPVSIEKWYDVELLMLRSKPGLVPVDNADRRFNCTMAAVLDSNGQNG